MSGQSVIMIAGQVLLLDAAFTKLQQYPAETLRKYDQPGPGAANRLSAAEIARTRAVSSRISKAEMQWFVEYGHTAPWPTKQLDLRKADPAVRDDTYDQMAALFAHFSDDAPRGIGTAKISKVLHLKQPGAFPILDSRIAKTYRAAATEAAERYPERGHKRMHWAAIREDLIRNSESGALAALRRLMGPAHPAESAHVTDLRLLDMLTWR